MYSMTGYGKGVASVDDKTVTVEIKTVNHRYLDWGLKLPKPFLFLEDGIKKTISAAIARGHVDVFVTLEQQAGAEDEFVLNEALAAKYIAAAESLGSIVAGRQGPNPSQYLEFRTKMYEAALRQPDVIARKTAATDPEKAENDLREVTSKALEEALAKLKEMRLREGEALKADISAKLDCIEALLGEIEALAPQVVANYREAMTSRIAEVVDASKVDEARLATEVALFADHCCVDEEITRLHSHIASARALLEEAEPVGRKLDFLVQEFNREANTIGSKANDLGITSRVLAIKNEIEKLREQSANIE